MKCKNELNWVKWDYLYESGSFRNYIIVCFFEAHR